MSTPLRRAADGQDRRNAQLLQETPLVGDRIRSSVLPLAVDLRQHRLAPETDVVLSALEKTAATTAIEALVSLANVNDLDHLGGGLELIGPLLMTLAIVDYEGRQFAIEHGHTSIGYYGALSALGFLPKARVVEKFRRSLDIAGHVSWVPGGTPLGSGRLGVTVPVATGLALGLRARHREPFVVCHCGDAGWISGQALNGFNAATLHGAPIAFVMHRNGIQLSGTTAKIMNRDPRPIISSFGVRILEIPSLHERPRLFEAYREAFQLAQEGKPALIYPVGSRSTKTAPLTIQTFAEGFGILDEASEYVRKHGIALDTPIWVPGSLMSYRDSRAMLQCVLYVNNLPGGEAHHDGGMKGRDAARTLANPMLHLNDKERAALDRIRQAPPRTVESIARPPKGTPNLTLDDSDLAEVKLPGPEKWVTPRAGSEAAYHAVAARHANRLFFVSCDLNPSTRLGKAAALLPARNQFEMSIEEQAAALLTNGLSMTTNEPQLNVFATFAAFFEGIAREGFEYWRYQRNLTGINDGLNVVMHLSHVGSCTGRDHFSGWSLDWISLALGYLPFLRRFYAPADARAAFLAVKDAAAGWGGHIVAIPRDNLPILTRAGTSEPIWNVNEEWTAVTPLRERAGARAAILAVGAPAYVAAAASDSASAKGVASDVFVVNGFPGADDFVRGLPERYDRLITIEDGLIGIPASGIRGFAAYVAGQVAETKVALEHLGIADPHVAPSESHLEVWKHYGLTEADLTAALLRHA
jgi:transketolase N-terminal domain/subunit/transketolase C-terminal domain/subunit